MAEEKNPKSNINQQYNSANAGLNQDNSLSQVKKGLLTYALNAAVENYDSNSVNYQNEPGNTGCIVFPKGYSLVGNHFIPERSKQIYMLANPAIGASQIGYMDNNDCVYRVLACSNCLNFDINHPIHKMVHKVTNFGVEIYWADNNGRRYLNIDDIPKPIRYGSTLCDPVYVDDDCVIDCAKIKLQPEFTIPVLKVIGSVSGGENTSGTVQFAAQYADAQSNPYTSYYGVTNPTPIADTNIVSVNFNYPVGKSIVVDIQNLDVTGKYQYFNLAVIKTVNGVSTPQLVGTYFIDRDNKQITYTGQNKTEITLSIKDIFEKFVYYDNADHVTTVQDILVWNGMTISKRINYQKIASQIKLEWQSFRLPAGEDYSDVENATNFRGYLRDEVYAFEIQWLLTNGKETDGFHIPGRVKNSFDIASPNIYPNNPDFIGNVDEGKDYASYWKIYNTATVIGTNPEYVAEKDYKGAYQHGEMAYWESTEEYPCNKDIWGDLSGKKIRHHKFPDVAISPIFESPSFPGKNSLVSENRAIYPLGVKIDIATIKSLIANSNLSQEEKNDIVGFKILRGDRGVNKSIVAKGMLRNVNKYKRKKQDYFYPNYPYNDVGEDPFINSVNNAWAQECKSYIVDVFNLPLQPDGERYVKLDIVSCENNKKATEKITKEGKTKVCSMTLPRFSSVGTYNKMGDTPLISQFAGENNVNADNYNNYLYKPLSSTDAIVYFASYDIWRVYWRDSGAFPFAGARAGWEDLIINNAQAQEWLRDRSTQNNSDNIIVRTPVGSKPYCLGENQCERSGKQKFKYELITTILADDCSEETPLPKIKDSEDLFYRQILNSPETSFGQPFLGNILKLESVMYGGGKAHFVEVKNNAKYRLLTEEAQNDALAASTKLGSITSSFNATAMFTAYQAYLQIYINGITRKNYSYSFNSIADYNYSVPVPDNFGIKQRTLDIKKYLIPGVQNVGEKDININNYNRETSVYLRTNGSNEDDLVTTAPLPLPSTSVNMAILGLEGKSRFTIGESGVCSTPELEQDIQVVSYYASLKNTFINQWGQIYSYQSIGTGFTVIFGKEELNKGNTIFGGDTFIGKFAYKTKVPFFIDNKVNAPDDSDIFYDELGNIGYPKYWHSARSILSSYRNTDPSVNMAPMFNMISYKAHNFDCKNSQELSPLTADPETNPDRTFYDGYMYQFAYGIPSFYCESSYNLDLRTAFNNREGEFWPHVSNGIPDEWVQEDNVSILNDNTYNYNSTYSKQNKESVITHLPEDWSLDYKNIDYPFRTVYSDVQNTNADNRVNSWLTYRAASYFDFPQNFGALTALDGMKNSGVLARFENKTLLYNQLVTIDTSNPLAAYVGNPRLFSNPPIDFAETDLGYIGSQHKFLLKCPQGAITADAKRGQFFLVNGTEVTDLTGFGSGMNRFFTDHLGFEILKYFPKVNIDNHFNGVGLHGVYDSKYERVLITKLDYIPLYKTITYDKESNKYYNTTDLKREVFLSDQEFFCNKSFTVSFNFNTKSWVSFHSYLPNYYVGENKYFYSGLNYCPNDFDVFVGSVINVFPTTTTSTTRFIQITTTTSTTTQIIDCDLEAIVEATECNIEGTATIIYIEKVCERPFNMRTFELITGYTLVTPLTDIDSTGSATSACKNKNYYSLYFGNENYTPKILLCNALQIQLGSTLYENNNTLDCSVIPNGWYFTDESSSDKKVFQVIDGVIVSILICNDGEVITTTSTTTMVGTSYCFTGIYTNPDPINPLGGVVRFINVFGVLEIIENIWAEDSVTILALSIDFTLGVVICN